MQTQETNFSIETKSETIQKIGKGIVLQPKSEFKGGTVKWYKDKLKSDR